GDMEGEEKDGVMPDPLRYAGETMEVGILRISDGWTCCPRLSGRGTLSASPIAAVMAVARAKRAFGSLARAVMITNVSAGGIFGLRRTGEVGVTLRCCESTAIGVSPRKGGAPVTIS